MSSVVIFDSGVGGLSIYQAVREKRADLDYVFVSDNQAFPYGSKDEPELIKRIVSVAEAIVERYAPQILVVACNTASTVVLPILRDKYSFPIVGVVPAIKPASKQSETRHIAILATPATIERAYTDNLIIEYASDCDVLKLGSSDLVKLAENKLYGEPFEVNAIESIVKPILDTHSIDVLVLACTHFPLLADELAAIFAEHNREIKILDSAQGIANRVHDLCITGLTDCNDAYSEASLDSRKTLKVAAFTESISQNSVYLTKLEHLGFSDIQTLSI